MALNSDDKTPSHEDEGSEKDRSLPDAGSESKRSQLVVEDDAAERALTRKLDLRLLPVLSLLYLLSFLDRSNVGNARIEGLAAKINLSNNDYNSGLAVYFVGYVLFEIPANIVLKKTSPKIWLPTLTLVWGIVSICQGLVHNTAGFFAVRFFLGVTEAGLFPGVIFTFSMFYTRQQRSVRVAFFFSGAALAGAFGGILAYGLARIQGGGKPGWAWIFIVEGLLTVAVSLASYYLVPTWPQSTSFLSESERGRLLSRLAKDADVADLVEPFSWRGVRQALTDPFVYLYCLLFHSTAFTLYTLSLFLPTIIKELGFATWKAQLLTTPPYAVAFLFTMLIAWGSLKYRRRAPFIIICAIVAIIGYIILISTKGAGGQYAGTFIVTAGVYAANSLVLSWPGENVSSQTKRAVALGMQIALGDLGAITGVLLYRTSFSGHLYRKPNIIALGYTVLTAATASALWFFLKRENEQRAHALEENTTEAGPSKSQAWGDGWKDEAELQKRRKLGDRHPRWRYHL